MALIAEKASSVTTDLKRIEADLESSMRDGTPAQGRMLELVPQLRQVIEQLEQSLTGKIDETTTRTLREAVSGLTVSERKTAERRREKAREFAAKYLNSFSERRYEAPPEFTQDLVRKDRFKSSARTHAHNEKQAATLVARAERDAAEEYQAIFQRLDNLKDEVMGKFVNDLTHADSVIEAMEAELKAPSEPPMSADAISLHLTGKASICETAIAQLQDCIDSLAGDADFVQSKKPSDPPFETLSERIAAIKREIDDLLTQFTEKAPQLLKEAESMRQARETTMFAQEPTLSGYRIMRRNGWIESVLKPGDRSLTAHESGHDYVQEYVIQPKTPSKLVELMNDGESVQSAAYCAVVHVHYNGTDETLKPTACHFKTWEQRGATNRDSETDVYYWRVNDPAAAAELIDDLEAAVKKTAESGASAPKRKNKKGRKGKRT